MCNLVRGYVDHYLINKQIDINIIKQTIQNNMEKSIEIKITFETIMKNFGSIHSFEKLRSKIKEKYNLNLGQSHYLVYIDDDGDEITISN